MTTRLIAAIATLAFALGLAACGDAIAVKKSDETYRLSGLRLFGRRNIIRIGIRHRPSFRLLYAVSVRICQVR